MRCETKTDWFFIVEKLGLIDIVITIFVPFLIIIVANVLISLKLMRSVIQRAQNANTQNQSAPATRQNNLNIFSLTTTQPTTINKSSAAINFRKSELRKRKKTYSRTTRMLLVISAVYLFLNAPIAFAKVRFFVSNMDSDLATNATALNADQNMTTRFDYGNISNRSDQISLQTEHTNTVKEELIERLTCYLYYLNFAINFLLYSLNGPTFIARFMSLLKLKIRK
jgi:hypothetical protein